MKITVRHNLLPVQVREPSERRPIIAEHVHGIDEDTKWNAYLLDRERERERANQCNIILV